MQCPESQDAVLIDKLLVKESISGDKFSDVVFYVFEQKQVSFLLCPQS